MKHNAFTLAEVLVTLMIIGVVAAMSIPSLFAQQEKVTYVTGLKKFYATFNNNMNSYLADQGCTGDIMCSGALGTTSMSSAQQLATFEANMPILFPDSTKLSTANTYTTYRQITNLGYTQSGSWPSAYQLKDGMIIYPFPAERNNSPSLDPTCTGQAFGIQECGYIAIDVNGLKQPNIMGRDLQFFSLNKKGQLQIIPFYKNKSYTTDCDPNSTTPYSFNGLACMSRILRENWQMNY